MKQIPLLAHVALVADLSEKGLTRGQLGTVVEKLGTDADGAFLVEFSGEDGEAYAFTELRPDQGNRPAPPDYRGRVAGSGWSSWHAGFIRPVLFWFSNAA